LKSGLHETVPNCKVLNVASPVGVQEAPESVDRYISLPPVVLFVTATSLVPSALDAMEAQELVFKMGLFVFVNEKPDST
jgi:hypothetical protein